MTSSASRPVTRAARDQTENDEATLMQSQHAQLESDEGGEPSGAPRGGTPDTDRLDGSGEEEENVDGAIPPHEEDERPRVAQPGPLGATPNQELQELRAWLQSAQALEELRSLQELRARYEAGDATAVLPTHPGRSVLPTLQATPSASLPRPEPPKQFAKRNRMEFNRWERDCEGYFLRSPVHFQTERQRVDFGVMYVSDPLRTLWESNCVVNTVNSPGWVPTWQGLKAVMLNSMGTPQERKKMAYDKLKAARQQASKSPTDLLDYMRPLWEELGPSVTPEMQLLEFSAALRHDIQIELERLPFAMRSTIPMVEEQANIVYRRKNPVREQKDQQSKTKSKGRRKDSQSSEGDQKTPKKAKKGKTRQSDPKGDKKAPPSSTPKDVTCYRCGEPGHKSYDCTNPEKPGSDPRAAKAGKGKGQKD
jgi:hypothetical protein